MRYQSFPKELHPHVKTWGDNIPALFDPKPRKPGDAGHYRYPKASTGERTLKTKKNAFFGELVFLIGPLNASLGFYLANNFRPSGVGAMIGETTGGCLRGINGGNLALMHLPSTDLDFPVLGGFSLAEEPATGVRRAIEVTPTLLDPQQGKDPILAAAHKFLVQRR